MIEPSLTIEPPEWMRTQSSQELMDILNDGDGEDSARFVGGCVRNYLLGVDVTDFDVACMHTPDVVIEKLEARGVKVIPTGIDHGTVTAVFDDGCVYEITTLRKDIATDGRRAVVSYTQDWLEDANRRDFTMNTILADIDGNIYDPTGRGIEDIKSGRVVFVGDADSRIREDYLRILRYFRFWAMYGMEDLDKEIVTICANHSLPLSGLSKERITSEFMKILRADRCIDVFIMFFKNNILVDLLPRSDDFSALSGLVCLQRRFDLLDEDFILRLFMCDDYSLGRLNKLFDGLRLSKRQMSFMQQIVRSIHEYDVLSDAMVKKVAYYNGKKIARGWAQCLAVLHNIDDVSRMLEKLEEWEIPEFPVTGKDLIEAGFDQGEALGAELKRMEARWVDGGYVASKMQCLGK